jgi:hypothetical protein
MREPEATNAEVSLLEHLGKVNDMFCSLPVQHIEDQDDFRRLVHRLQDMVAARVAFRQLGRTIDGSPVVHRRG